MGVLKVIVVAYKRVIPLRMLIDCFMVQTSPSWELHIIHDGPAPDEVCEVIGLYDDKRVNWYQSAKREGKYGHPNRKKMLQNVKAGNDDFILITNDDNLYTPIFVQKILDNATKSIGLIYCNMLHNYYSYDVLNTQLKINLIDMGAFVVRADIAKKVGFNSTKFEADGIYAEECAKYCTDHKYRIIKLENILFIHN